MDEKIKETLKSRGYSCEEIKEIEDEYIEAKNEGINIPVLEFYFERTGVLRNYYINEDGNWVDEETYF